MEDAKQEGEQRGHGPVDDEIPHGIEETGNNHGGDLQAGQSSR